MAKKEVAVGIDLGGTNTVFGFVDRDGKILGEDRIKTSEYEEIEVFVAALYEKIMLTGKKIGNGIEVIGYGIGAPMGNINKGTIEHAAGLPWKGIVPLAETFKRHTDLPVVVTNDANAAAVGEMIYGGAKEMKNFVVITLGTGLGSGFVIDGKLVYGHDGFAGEIGHTAIRPGESNRECGCGRKGCLETYVSATGLKRSLLKIMADSMKPSELRKYSFEELDAEIIHDAALRGDYLAKRAFTHTGRMLGFKLADVVAHTNPEAIFLFGGLALAKDLIFEPAKEYMEENLLSIYKGKVKLLASELSTQNAAVLGASSPNLDEQGVMNIKLINLDIANFGDILNHILGVVFILIVLALAYAYLKPHQLHKRRMLSTLLLKVSYLVYLLILLIVIYFSALERDGLEQVFMGIEFFAFLVVLFVPTIGIFARKLGQFSKKREGYNYFFTIVNVLSIVAVLVMYFV